MPEPVFVGLCSLQATEARGMSKLEWFMRLRVLGFLQALPVIRPPWRQFPPLQEGRTSPRQRREKQDG